jgi:hypothetical protein
MKSIFILCLVTMIYACGGGGSSSTPPPPPSQYPLDSAISAFQQMNHNYNLTATSGSNTFALQIDFAPGTQSTFDGMAALTSTETITLYENGVSQGTNTGTFYFTISPYTQIGGIFTNGEVEVDANQMALPDLATVGQTGPFDTYITYTDNTKTTVYETATVTWSLETDTVTSALACLNYEGTMSGSPFSESDCYQIDENGNVLSIQITLNEGGGTLVFK